MNALQKAIKERDDFLKKNPHLIKRQQEIDEILNACREEDRITVIGMMLTENILQLQKETLKLQKIVNGKEI